MQEVAKKEGLLLVPKVCDWLMVPTGRVAASSRCRLAMQAVSMLYLIRHKMHDATVSVK